MVRRPRVKPVAGSSPVSSLPLPRMIAYWWMELPGWRRMIWAR
jgi:hypothetical protein